MYHPHDAETLAFTRAQEAKMQEVIRTGHNVVHNLYGTGYPDYRGGTHENYWYHALRHTAAGDEAAQKMQTSSGLSSAHFLVARALYAWHDTEQMKKGFGRNEAESAGLFRDEVRRKGLPELVGRMGSIGIKSTACRVSGVVRYKNWDWHLSEQERPLVRLDCMRTLRSFVRSLDFVHLYTPEGPLQSFDLYCEINKLPRGAEESTMPKFNDFQKSQLGLVRGYKYPHPAAEQQFGKPKDRLRVVQHTRRVLEAVRSGELASLQGVRKAHEAFAKAAKRV